MPKVPNLFVPSEQLRPIQMPAAQAPGGQPYVDTQAQQIEKLGAGMERLGQGAMSFAGDMRAVQRLQAQEAERQAQAAMRTQDRIDDSKLKEQDAAFSEFSRDLLQNPSHGYLNMRGQTAIDSRVSIIDSWDKRAKEIEDSLQNDTQRNGWKLNVARRRSDFMSNVDTHFSKEAKQSDLRATESHINASRNDAVMAIQSDDPKVVAGFDTYKNTIVDNVNHLAQENGIPLGSDQHKLMLLDETTKLHSDVIQAFLNNDQSKRASEYFDQWKDSGEINANVRSILGNQISKHQDKDDGLDLGAKLMERRPPPDMSLVGSFSDIKIFERADRLAQSSDAIAQVRQQMESNTIKASVGLRAIDTIEKILDQEDRQYNRSARDVLARGVQWLNNNPTKLLSDNYDLQEEARAFGMSDNLAVYSKNRDIATDPILYKELMAYSDEEWRKVDADKFSTAYFGRLNSTHMDYFMRRINKAQGSLPKSDIEKSFEDDLLKTKALNLGIIVVGPKQKPDDVQKFQRIQTAYWAARKQDPSIPKEKLMDEVFQTTPNNEVIAGLDPKAKAEVEFTVSQGKTYTLGEIPQDELTEAYATIRKSNASKGASEKIPETYQNAIQVWHDALESKQQSIWRYTIDGLEKMSVPVSSATNLKDRTVSITDAQLALGITAKEIQERSADIMASPSTGYGSDIRDTRNIPIPVFAAIQRQLAAADHKFPDQNMVKSRMGSAAFYKELQSATNSVDVPDSVPLDSTMSMFFQKPDRVDPAYWRSVLDSFGVRRTSSQMVNPDDLRQQYTAIRQFVRKEIPAYAK